MKTLRLLLVFIALPWTVFGQATVIFGNRLPGQVDARVTRYLAGAGFFYPADDRFLAQLYAAAPGLPLQPVGDPVPFRHESEAAKGYFFSEVRTIPGVPAGGAIQAQIRVWFGALGNTYEEAVQLAQGGIGISGTILLPETGGGLTPPVPLTGLQGFVVAGLLVPGPDARPVVRGESARSPALMGSLSGGYEWLETPNDLQVSGARAYLAAGWSGLLTVDITEPRTPGFLGYHGPRGRYAEALVADATHIYVSSRGWAPVPEHLLSVYSRTNAVAPTAVAEVALPATVHRMERWQDQLLLACGDAGFFVMSVGNPGAPTGLTRVAEVKSANELAVSGDVALVSAGSNGLLVVDLHATPTPRVLAVLPTVRPAGAVATDGTTAILALESEQVLVLDVSDPNTPRIQSVLTLPRTPTGMPALGAVAIAGRRAFVASGSPAHLTAVDLQDPTHAEIVGDTSLRTATTRMHAAGDVLWLSDWLGLTAMDVGTELTLQTPRSVTLHGHAGGRYQLEATDQAATPTSWSPLKDVTLDAPSQEIALPDSGSTSSRLVRARRL